MLYEYGIASVVFCEVNSTYNLTQINQPTTTTLLRVIIVNIYIRQNKKEDPLGGSRSREIGIFKQLLRRYPGHIILCFADY